MDKKHFALLAGTDDQEAVRKLMAVGYELPRAQEILHKRGHRSVEVGRSLYGWNVRSGSGLDGFALWFVPPGQKELPDKGFRACWDWAKKWASRDPERCQAYMRRSYLSVFRDASPDEVPIEVWALFEPFVDGERVKVVRQGANAGPEFVGKEGIVGEGPYASGCAGADDVPVTFDNGGSAISERWSDGTVTICYKPGELERIG